MNSDSLEVAWAAGLFEGEGCIIRQNSNYKYWYMQLAVNLTDFDTLARFASTVEGHTTGPYKPKGVSKKPFWSWRETRQAHVNSILTAFWPYLGERRKSRAVEIISSGNLELTSNQHWSFR